MNRIEANEIVNSIDSLETIKTALQACLDRGPERIEKTGTWQYHASKLLAWLNSNMRKVIRNFLSMRSLVLRWPTVQAKVIA